MGPAYCETQIFGGRNVLHRFLPISLFLTSQGSQETHQKNKRLEELIDSKWVTCSNVTKLVSIKIIGAQDEPN